MKVVELLKLGGEMLKLMSRNEVNRDDWRFVPMYEAFQEMRQKGVKYREAVTAADITGTGVLLVFNDRFNGVLQLMNVPA